jgi:hypothetical protein
VKRRAYFLWLEAGKPLGDPARFWLEAEDELREEADEGVRLRG